MSEEEESLEDVGEEVGSSLPHTPPLGIKAVRSGEDPNPIGVDDVDVTTGRERPAGNWMAALVLSAGVVVSIIGTFLPWIEISENQYRSNLIGWDQGGSAWIVLIIGTLAAGVTGPVWNGSRSLLVNVLFIFFGTEALEVFDVVGAGDMVISILAMLISSNATPSISAHWAQIAAAMEIQHVGVVSFEREEIRKRFVYGHTSTKIVSLKRLQQELALKDESSLVITNGYFDKLSSTHLKFLGQLREFKGFTVVAINSDASIQRKKGEPPLLDEMERARLLASLQSIDRVIIFEEDDCCKIFRCLMPKIVVKGTRYQHKQIEESKVIEEIGARVEFLPEYSL